MDEFINSYVSSPVWPDTISSRSSWDGALACQTNGLIDDSLETHGHGNNQIERILPPDDIIGNTTDEDLNLHRFSGAKSFFTDGNTKFENEKGLSCGERSSHHSLGDPTLQQNLISKDTFVRNCSLQGVIGDTPAARPFNSAIAHNSMTVCNSIPSNENDLSAFSQLLGNANPFNSFPPIWPSSYSGVSSFRGQSKMQHFGFRAGEISDDVLMKTCIDDTQLNSFNAVFLHQNDQNGLQSFSAGQQISLMSGDLQHEKVRQFSTSSERFNTTNQINNSGTQAQTTPTNTNGCNGATKPRVRARRGQATDPHSIAERLRREKIAEGMRNLQELVPSSNKTDKASMLDEIIDYVKFLQLQVKVLSMSRLGAAGAVLPLLTNTRTEGSGSILVPSSAGEGGADILESEDCLAFEQEVVKLMESNVTSAIQYLQNKGLCLMPIALATAISRQKGSSTAIPPEHQKVGVFSNCSHNHIETSPNSGANSCNGTAVKQKESQKRFES